MEQLIKAIINGHSTVDVSEESKVQIHKIDASSYHVLHGNQSHHIKILSIDRNDKKVSFKIDESPYEVMYKDEVDATIEQMGLNAIIDTGPQDCMAPMPGLVLAIKSSIGSEVQEGDPLLILEAMKMENVIKAAHPGVIKEILVVEGDKVEKGQLLVTYEPEVRK
jgi:biotin carboxyl carrier protein